jgi:exopolyphosphatase/guanosine-5'-triphosphate,3'-diphosphate pyrophosphatase
MGRRPHYFAAIDVGTNAVRLKIARAGRKGLEIVHAKRAAVAPGEGVFEHGVMAEAVIDRVGAALSDFGDVCRFHRAEVRAVATSALRTAQNRTAALAAVQRRSGVALDVIDGAEEARLTALGVVAGRDEDERTLCIDVGGGSTEVMLSEGERLASAASVDVGSARLRQQAERAGHDLAGLREAAREALNGVTPGLARRWLGPYATAIGCSGSVRALVSFATAGARRYVTRHELSSAVEELARMPAAERTRFFSVQRAPVILPAAVILEQTLHQLDVWAVRATRRGLRDGVLVELSRAPRERARVAS